MNISLATNQKFPECPVKGFYITEEVGAGNYGTVFRIASEQDLKDTRILKIPKLNFGDTTTNRSRFILEANLLSQINHPNIVKLIENGLNLSADIPYYQMVDLNQQDLYKWRGENSAHCNPCLTREESTAIARGFSDLAKAIKYLWNEFNCVHRDIKPQNILIPVNGELTFQFCDFGAARKKHFTPRADGVPEAPVGSFPWMAPEQVKMEDIDISTDIYGLGATLYYVLTAREPIESYQDEFFQNKNRILREIPNPVSYANKFVPPELSEIIASCLEKKKLDRPNVDDLINTLRSV